jgi:hypothetical protein
MEPIERMDQDAGRKFPAAFAAGAGVVLVFIVGIVFLTKSMQTPGGPKAVAKLPFGPVEQAYANRIHFGAGQMARSSNLLNQEFTYIAGTLSNDGDRPLRALDATFEFHDQFNQVILRQEERLIGTNAQPVGAGQHFDFQITLEYVPSTWSQQYPTIRVTGLTLQ